MKELKLVVIMHVTASLVIYDFMVIVNDPCLPLNLHVHITLRHLDFSAFQHSVVNFHHHLCLSFLLWFL